MTDFNFLEKLTLATDRFFVELELLTDFSP